MALVLDCAKEWLLQIHLQQYTVQIHDQLVPLPHDFEFVIFLFTEPFLSEFWFFTLDSILVGFLRGSWC